MKVTYKRYLNRQAISQDLEDINKNRNSNTCQFYVMDKSIELEIFEGALSAEDQATILAISEKYSGISFKHKKITDFIVGEK